jgi:hypothetical protein
MRSDIISGETMSKSELPDWEKVLSSASHLQQLLNDAVLVGGTAAAIYSKHRFSRDADHVLTELTTHFNEILEILESTPLPYDLEVTNLREYKNLVAPWTEWVNVEKQCQKVAKVLFESR